MVTTPEPLSDDDLAAIERGIDLSEGNFIDPEETRALIARIRYERERAARIVEALIDGANEPETDAILTTIAAAIRSLDANLAV